MGKLLVKIGLKIQAFWHRVQCLWNTLLLKLTVHVHKCPKEKCACNR